MGRGGADGADARTYCFQHVALRGAGGVSRMYARPDHVRPASGAGVAVPRGGACVRRRCPRRSSHAARLALAASAHRVAGLREPPVRTAGEHAALLAVRYAGVRREPPVRCCHGGDVHGERPVVPGRRRYLAAGQGALPSRQRGAGRIAHDLDDDEAHPAVRAPGACDRRRAGCGAELRRRGAPPPCCRARRAGAPSHAPEFGAHGLGHGRLPGNCRRHACARLGRRGAPNHVRSLSLHFARHVLPGARRGLRCPLHRGGVAVRVLCVLSTALALRPLAELHSLRRLDVRSRGAARV